MSKPRVLPRDFIRYTLRLSPALRYTLEKKAKRRKISVATFLRKFIEDKIDKY